MQARWLAAVLAGAVPLPDEPTMHAEIDAHFKALRQRYVDSPRYTLEVDYREHAGQLKRDLERATLEGIARPAVAQRTTGT